MMTTIDRVLLPFALFIIYYAIALWYLHQSSTTMIESSALLTVEIPNYCPTNLESQVTIQTDFKISRDWLETQSHKKLKAIASEFSIEVSDKRYKSNYINSILTQSIRLKHSKITC